MSGGHSSRQSASKRRGWPPWCGVLAAVLVQACGAPNPGARCVEHRDCAWLPEGYCARVGVCTRSCGAGAPMPTCPEGSVCSVQGARAVCLPLCTDDAACLAGFACRSTGDAGACVVIDGLAVVDAGA